jgi:hypothetical protein
MFAVGLLTGLILGATFCFLLFFIAHKLRDKWISDTLEGKQIDIGTKTEFIVFESSETGTKRRIAYRKEIDGTESLVFASLDSISDEIRDRIAKGKNLKVPNPFIQYLFRPNGDSYKWRQDTESGYGVWDQIEYIPENIERILNVGRKKLGYDKVNPETTMNLQ